MLTKINGNANISDLILTDTGDEPKMNIEQILFEDGNDYVEFNKLNATIITEHYNRLTNQHEIVIPDDKESNYGDHGTRSFYTYLIYTTKGIYVIDRTGTFDTNNRGFLMIGNISDSVYPICVRWNWHYQITTVNLTSFAYDMLKYDNGSIKAMIEDYTYVLGSDYNIYMCKRNYYNQDGSLTFRLEYCKNSKGEIEPIIGNVQVFPEFTSHAMNSIVLFSADNERIILIPYPLYTKDLSSEDSITWAKNHIEFIEFPHGIISYEFTNNCKICTVKYNDASGNVCEIVLTPGTYDIYKSYCQTTRTGPYSTTINATLNDNIVLQSGLTILNHTSAKINTVKRGESMPNIVANSALVNNEKYRPQDSTSLQRAFTYNSTFWYTYNYICYQTSSERYIISIYPEDTSCKSDDKYCIKYHDSHAEESFNSDDLIIHSMRAFSNLWNFIDIHGYNTALTALIATNKGLFSIYINPDAVSDKATPLYTQLDIFNGDYYPLFMIRTIVMNIPFTNILSLNSNGSIIVVEKNGLNYSTSLGDIKLGMYKYHSSTNSTVIYDFVYNKDFNMFSLTEPTNEPIIETKTIIIGPTFDDIFGIIRSLHKRVEMLESKL